MLDGRGIPIPAVTSFLRYLDNVGMSPNTIDAYAHDLAHFFSFLEETGQLWTAVTNDVLAQFVRYMRTPLDALVRPSNPEGQRSRKSVNRAMTTLSSYSKHLHDTTNDQVYVGLLRTARRRRNRFSELDETLTTIGPRMRIADSEKRTLSDGSITAIIEATSNLRDRFLFTLLDETGLRIGQALLLRHSDIKVPNASIRVMKYDDVEGVDARNKSYNYAVIPVSASLIRLYAAYMHSEYKYLDSDFVFVNLWAGEYGSPLTYRSVEQLVYRLRRKTGIYAWTAHTFRHSFVTRMLAKKVPVETISYLVTHSSVQTTLDTYNHLDVEHVREQLIEAGAWERG
ncbi:tyrosine-type recombinase/integrase [Microbacterium sp. A93]|uniref:tyrosine-type recombinase/integrase n=1 Tax=Microbacterium sp. A93 TaxID=3450716 RepID=UPI003F443375